MEKIKKIILDTNFIMAVPQFKIDIFSEIERIADFPYQLCILDKTTEELENIIKKQKGRQKKAAKLCMALLNHKKLKAIKTEKNADEALLELSKDSIIATQDQLLARRIKESSGKTIALRQKKYLVFR